MFSSIAANVWPKTEVVYYRKLPLGIVNVETGESVYLLGVFYERPGNLRRTDAQGRVDVNAKLVSLGPLPNAPDDLKEDIYQQMDGVKQMSWKSMYGDIKIGNVTFTTGLYSNMDQAVKGE